ncbi:MULTISPECIES: hypothetical protein [Paraburkholderia]|jgi:hypothetical protein|uniref:Uncharacterized protein n=1 Tax=Paraburkholderia madseniana TaxID=2599607 RepID=A0A6N6WIJ4_9BURK|nr:MULTISPECIES: hypothetical protein [Paraburkholderia]KAE8760487.1 hypothetical protein FSO04_08095 [Paraburkholderia madseniana]MCX4144952.1 hypothetical protein [Paraburkholderia madseniana]MCX4172593.1 hypothetical protein [Paraburkholderia madseniana]MDN7147904.1 hypothetical protein [Paraburkholderia sp. WS6]MDQ6406784.1 hypothetical protein [Paraburkholderia madseniana]
MAEDLSNEFSPDEAGLRAWMLAWYDHAVSVGFLHPPFTLNDGMAERLEGYFRVGLTPAEGAEAFFGVAH